MSVSARWDATRAAILVGLGSVSVQLSAVVAYGLFASLGTTSTATFRLFIGAVILLLVFRPSVRGRTRSEWFGILLYGISMAAIVLFLYLAIARIPLGIAMTINFLGACAVSVFASRRIREVLLSLATLVGVALITGLGGPFDVLGLVYACCSAASLALYTVLVAYVGQSRGGLPSVALSMTVAALLTMPFYVPVIPSIELREWGLLLLSALFAPMLNFTADTWAGRFTSARVIGVLFACDPVMGTIIGALLLGQVLTLPTLIGIALVVVAGAGIVWSAGDSQPLNTVR